MRRIGRRSAAGETWAWRCYRWRIEEYFVLHFFVIVPQCFVINFILFASLQWQVSCVCLSKLHDTVQYHAVSEQRSALR